MCDVISGMKLRSLTAGRILHGFDLKGHIFLDGEYIFKYKGSKKEEVKR